MKISKASVEDAAELNALVNYAYRGEGATKGWTSESHLLNGTRINEETIVEYLENPNVTILKYTEGANEIKACVYLEVMGENLYLGMLTVSPHLQANGIGKKLLAEAELLARKFNCAKIVMTVITSRHELLAWYERRGYKRTGKLLPFHAEEKFGKPKMFLQLEGLEKLL